jgi:GntR family transcriptional regulator / MocR family aminotransferase
MLARLAAAASRLTPPRHRPLRPPTAAPTLRTAAAECQSQFLGNVTGPISRGSVASVEVHVSLLGRADLAGEIYRQLRDAILTGRLRPGESLPPTRELARRLSVARGTVAVAYDRLSGEGFVTSQAGSGTFVSEWVARGERTASRADCRLRPRPVWARIQVSAAFAAPARYELRTGLPDASRFPFQTWRGLMARELRSSAVGRGEYGDPAGHPALRAAIARHVGASRGVVAAAEDVTVTSGTQQAFDLIARVLLAPGDRVAVEDPGYAPSRWLFDSLGLDVAGVPVDDHGLVVDALPASVRLVYVTPSHQYPLGAVMSLSRRVALLEWADRHDAAIIEDDYDSEFRYGGRPIDPLSTLDTSGRVIYVGSFSKSMLPTLRVGFVIAPPALSGALRAAKYVTDWHTSLPTQAALARFIDDGHLSRHIRRMRGVYRRRHDTIVGILAGQFSRHLTTIPSAAGLHVSALARTATADQMTEIAERALANGVAVQPLSMFQVTQPARAGLALGYGAIEADDINAGMILLLQVFGDS